MSVADIVTGTSYLVLFAIAGSLAVLWWLED
jgi:hypothetical protein